MSSSKRSGKFIVLEGVNGSGKSTLIPQIAHYLERHGINSLVTREPGGSAIGESLRAILLGGQTSRLSPITELFLFAADRSEHVTKVIKPALDSGRWVVCDRYYYSTTAFQGYGRKIDLQQIDYINKLAIHNLYPDLVFLLDLDPAEGLRRTKKRASNDKDSFELEEIAFHERIRNGFLEIAKSDDKRFVTIDARQSQEEVKSQICNKINSLFLSGQ